MRNEMRGNEMRRMSYVWNPYGVKVKRCCASCKHREVRKSGQRVCRLTQDVVLQCHRCHRWQMRDAYMVLLKEKEE